MATTMGPPTRPLRGRLLADIAEVQQEPYPNIHFYMNEQNIYHACVVLTPPGEMPLHLEIEFPLLYSLSSPRVTIQSQVDHPNIMWDSICASILDDANEWTPAYTLKGILIQLLSFFLSDNIEQNHDIPAIDLASYRAELRAEREAKQPDYHNKLLAGYYIHECNSCGFNASWAPPDSETRVPVAPASTAVNAPKSSKLYEIPDDAILNLLSYLDTRDIVAFSDALPGIKDLLTSRDFIRVRELQCFCLKKSFMVKNLGIGVHISKDRKPVFRSEFDLLSGSAYCLFKVRKSVHGIPFKHWLPVPLSRRHWRSVKWQAGQALEELRLTARLQHKDPITVLYQFMNTIVVQFSKDAASCCEKPDARSTLSHVSEKAVESYFLLFHLLLCLATDYPGIVNNANRKVADFVAGPRNKQRFPDLGHLLVEALISDAGLTQQFIDYIIAEAIVRNVVWMLDPKGAGMVELAYIEPTAVSAYRLRKTFEASRTSYRLLMFMKLFSSAARTPGKTLVQLRDELFDTHSAPPPGTSADMARKIGWIHSIDSFDQFLIAMGTVHILTEAEFTGFLQRSIGDSEIAGYSRMPLNQSELYMIRSIKFEPTVEVSRMVHITAEVQRWHWRYNRGWTGVLSFFPGGGYGGY